MERQENYDVDYENEVDGEVENTIPQEPEVEEELSAEPSLDEGFEEDASEEPKRKGKMPAHTRIQQIQREKYQALDELNRIREENEYLRRMALDLNYKAEESGNAAMIHYDKSANLKLDQAKAKKAHAIENGDIQAQLDADVEIASATNELQQIRSWKAQQALEAQNRQLQQQQEAYYQQQQAPNQVDPADAYNWLENNPWFVPQNENYNPEMVEAVKSYSDQVENYLYRVGRPDLIMSKEYFQEIDNYVNSLQSSARRGLNMKPVRGGVAPVRNSASHSVQEKQQFKLTSEEKDMARRLGVSDQVYMQHKINDMQKNPNKRRFGL